MKNVRIFHDADLRSRKPRFFKLDIVLVDDDGTNFIQSFDLHKLVKARFRKKLSQALDLVEHVLRSATREELLSAELKFLKQKGKT